MHFLCFLSRIPNLCVTDAHIRDQRASYVCVRVLLRAAVVWVRVGVCGSRAVCVRAVRGVISFSKFRYKRYIYIYIYAHANSVGKIREGEGALDKSELHKRLKNMRSCSFFSARELSFKEINRRRKFIRFDKFVTKLPRRDSKYSKYDLFSIYTNFCSYTKRCKFLRCIYKAIKLELREKKRDRERGRERVSG